MGIIRENGVERDFLRDSLYRQGDQVIAKNILGATKFNTDLLPFTLVTLVLYYVLLFTLYLVILVPLLCAPVIWLPWFPLLSASLLACPSSISMMGISSSFYWPYPVVLELLYLSV